LGKKNDERTPSKEASDKHKEESAGSIKSRVTRIKRNEEGDLLRDRFFITFYLRH
jgi:hypothetical protein